MRIIGGRDYYDGAGYGYDDSITFVRKPSVVSLDSTPLVYLSRTVRDCTLYLFEVVVAGEVYRGLRVHSGYSMYAPRTERIIYDQIEAEKAVEDYPQYIREHYSDLSIDPSRRERIRQWSLDNKVTTAISGANTAAITDYNRRGYDLFNSFHQKYEVLLNSDALKDVQMYRALPPAEAHRAISAWVGGVLPFNTPTEVLSNRSKIIKAGFDLRTSFRKMKA
jgi:hypothetical protein